jgi:hypothetical protein
MGLFPPRVRLKPLNTLKGYWNRIKKNRIKIGACLLALALPVTAQAWLLSSTVTAMWDDINPTAKYKLKT